MLQASETAATLTVGALYGECTLAGVKVTVDTSSCHFLFTNPTTTDALNPPYGTHAAMHIVCGIIEGGGAIVIEDTPSPEKPLRNETGPIAHRFRRLSDSSG
jgi:hypothetical protein